MIPSKAPSNSMISFKFDIPTSLNDYSFVLKLKSNNHIIDLNCTSDYSSCNSTTESIIKSGTYDLYFYSDSFHILIVSKQFIVYGLS